MNCREATRLMSEAMDRKLSAPERLSLRLHTAICSGCRNFRGHMSAMRQITQAYVRRTDDESPPHDSA
ncbi:zf-HC2 domain-containing protein [Uliginosibacterium gangwonense]|uniref:zf-HC2 domain-containing protein n=1 Tax=Uliginosibacterium gangwonense TaxID=392736 RepID=UPI00036ABA50|nr:zf-HC2 domain-containing protein [Uliginosibacterium gangwonense]